jgi:hypothetical protein
MRCYILKNRKPIPVPVEVWGAWMASEPNERIIEQTQIGDIKVSTAFLGLDHGYCFDGKLRTPILFETMIFGGPEAVDQRQWRYATLDGAERGHKAAIDLVMQHLPELPI